MDEFEQAPVDGDGQGRLACCSPWSRKESDMTERLNCTEEIKREIKKKILEINDSENRVTQNLLDSAKVVLRGKLIVVQSYFRQ